MFELKHNPTTFVSVKTKTIVNKINPKSHPDQRFIVAISNNESKVIKEIYHDFYPRIETLIRKNRGTAQDAKDVFNDALRMIFLKSQKENITIEVSFYSFLRTICYRRWLNQLERLKKFNTDIENLPESSIDDDLLQDIMNNEKILFFRNHVKRLSEYCRQILELRFEGRKFNEIAEALNKNAGAVRKRSGECIKTLQEQVRNDPNFAEFKA